MLTRKKMLKLKINKKYSLADNEGSSQLATPRFIIAHSTATPNGEAWAIARNMKTSVNVSQTYVHLVIDDKNIYQVGELGYVAWGAGSPANSLSPVQIELCEFTDHKRAIKAYKHYVNWLRWSAKKYGIPLTLDDSKNRGIKTHSWLVQHGYSNTDHVDPWQYLPKIGVSKAKFAKDLTKGFSGANIALTR
ncbi:N-acetylmuramoyl-L-alanine amidase [Lactobacillus sp. ESL0236]|uniref:peptidoglycan recognition protein family protein n=1 Tax=Lactobacillus sp. ESL0234 TaxID=2069355 RepID=UPI000EFB1AC8|nr:peptidoglycan recognition family protein [Lactobacillus sp. ESL0234]RMC36911.1 N-acetylmuramoyl-L-alanine amidase [Lactobacillus sp. ESL0237]RMC42596.1 N-acetylmuramoyl-L-alanine amidase [Lactobacillus sp. ESL0234]RMC43256.1 N-acetylmuramoyl-L-alanine amidase [Lactobacillus sp. ESL0236]